jgi:vancomycin permeability regulator SanA
MKKKIRFSLKWPLYLLGCALLIALPWIFIRWKTQGRVVSLSQTPPSAPVAIVFGAGLYRDGTPMPVLADRVRTAVDLYKAGAVRKLLLSGDNRFKDYNEPEAMRALAVELGVPETDLVLDYAGRSTYDTCYRARFVFAVRNAILVSQAFHLPRAVYLCDQIGIESAGVASDRQPYRRSSEISWNLREVAACFAALLDAHILHPQTVLGPMEPIQ